MAAVRHGKDISIRFGQGVFKLVLGGFYGFGDTRSRPFDDKLAGVLVGGSAADRVDSAVEHILYKALREVKPLKLLSELLFSSRFMSSGISEVSKFFPESHSIISARLCLHGNWRLEQEHLNT